MWTTQAIRYRFRIYGGFLSSAWGASHRRRRAPARRELGVPEAVFSQVARELPVARGDGGTADPSALSGREKLGTASLHPRRGDGGGPSAL